MSLRFACFVRTMQLSALAMMAVIGSPAVSTYAQGRVPWTILSSTYGDLPPPSGGDQQTTCVVADFNKDGRADFVITDRSVPASVILYLRQADGWSKYIIEASRLPIEAGGDTADIDGDGDLDLALGQDFSGGQAWWWENPYPNLDPAVPWTRHLIKNGTGTMHHDERFGDFDGDGQLEFATWVNLAQRVEIYEIPSDPTQLWTLSAIIPISGEGMDVIDIDLDGKVDILAGGSWIRHDEDEFYSVHPIDPDYSSSRILGAQIIPGGRPEVLMNSGDGDGPLNMYRWENDQWLKTTLIPFVVHGHSLEAGDVDGDGHLDIFTAEMGSLGAGAHAKAWMGWGDGRGNFSFEEISTGLGNHMSRLADLDGDGDLDIVMKPYNFGAPRVDVFLNNGTHVPLSLTNWVPHLIDASLPAISIFIQAADLDGDGDLDLVAGGWWWANPGLLSEPWIRHTIGSDFNNLVAIGDFDGDGDTDLFGTTGVGAAPNHTLRWARNDGSGNFEVLDNIQSGTAGDFPQGRLVGTFQAGLHQVFISWHDGAGGIQALTIPADPVHDTWPMQIITPTTETEDLSAGDIDGDGDLDILLGTSWLENTGTNWITHVLGSVTDLGGEPDRNDLADVDHDGDLDAVVGLEGAEEILWFENPQPNGDVTGLWTRHLIGRVPGQGLSMDTRDLDGDHDPEVVVGEHRGTDVNRVIIFENDGSKENWPSHVIDTQPTTTTDHHDGTQLIDMDGDGDLDIISLGWTNPKVWLFENTAPEPPTVPVVKPVISPNGGTFIGSVQIKISCPTPEAEIRYTLDGTEPTNSNSLYVEPFTLAETAVVKARGFKAGRTSSAMVSANFVIVPDHFPPELLSASARGNPDRVVLRFSEPVDAASAQNLSNYWISHDVTITAAELQPSLSEVHLLVSQLSVGPIYSLRVRNLRDRSVPPNPLVGDVFVTFAYTEEIVSDDFSTGELNPALWTFVNPLGDAQATISEQTLRIEVPGGRSHDVWTTGNQAPRVMQWAEDKDFEVEAKFQSQVTKGYAFQGLLVEQSEGNFLRLDVYSDGTTVFLFAAKFTAGVPTTLVNAPIATSSTYGLRILREGNHWTCTYSTDGGHWQAGASFDFALAVSQVGVFAANAGANPPVTALVDYFFNTHAPIPQEDSLAATITGHPTDVTVPELTPATFAVLARGAAPCSFQWRRDGISIPGATNSTYTFGPVSKAMDDQSQYDVVVSNPFGSETSQAAILTVDSPVPENGLTLWLRADVGTLRDGPFVNMWEDQSPQGRLALTTSTQNRPTWVNGLINGLPAVRFDGTNDFFTLPLPINGLEGMSIFLVTANTKEQNGGSTQAEQAAIYWHERSFWGTVYFSPFQTNVNLGFGTTQPFHQLRYLRPASIGSRFSSSAAIKNGATDSIYVNGQLVLSQGGKLPQIAGNGDICTVARGYDENTYYAGDIAEVLVYARALTESERQTVESYLDNKYELTPHELSLGLTPTARGFLLQFRGTPGRLYDLQRTADVIVHDWATLLRTRSPDGFIQFEDVRPAEEMGFYRVVVP